MRYAENTEMKTALSIPIQVEVTPGARNAYAESLQMILQHVADFHLTVVDIISEKYNIPVDEIMKTVTSDSRYTNMVVNPNIHRVTSLDKIETQIVETSAPAAPAIKKISEKKIKIKPKNVVLLP
jgi:hypothetical protein